MLFDTYLKGQGNPDELKEYIAAGVDSPDTINIIANEIQEWQNKAAELKAAEHSKKEEKEREKEKINDFVAQRTKKLKEEKEQQRKEKEQERKEKEQERKDKGEKPERKERERPEREDHRKPKARPAPADPPAEPKESEAKDKENNGEQEVEGQEEAAALKKGLKHELQEKGKEKCRFYPYCKNLDTCEFFHPSERVSPAPLSARTSPTAATATPASTSTRPAASRRSARAPTAPTRTPTAVTPSPRRGQPHRGNDEDLHEQEQPPQPRRGPQAQTLQAEGRAARRTTRGAAARMIPHDIPNE